MTSLVSIYRRFPDREAATSHLESVPSFKAECPDAYASLSV